MLVGNYTIPSSNIAPSLNYGDLDSFEELTTGNFLLDSNTYLPIINAYSQIKEFRFYCYKPSIGKVVDFATDPGTYWGSYINRYILGEEVDTSCPPPCGVRALSMDQSEISAKINRIGWSNIGQKFYGAACYENRHRTIMIVENINRFECDDQQHDPNLPQYNPSNNAGKWRFYIR